MVSASDIGTAVAIGVGAALVARFVSGTQTARAAQNELASEDPNHQVNEPVNLSREREMIQSAQTEPQVLDQLEKAAQRRAGTDPFSKEGGFETTTTGLDPGGSASAQARTSKELQVGGGALGSGAAIR